MNFHSGLAATLAPLPLGRPIRWYYVRPRFQALLENLKITEEQAKDGQVKHQGIVSCLNRAYWNSRDDAIHRILIGSWGKFTRVRPPRDVDILFVLPVEVYWRFQQRTGNRQSQLLQEVKSRLQTTYPQTDIRGDGQVVVPFNTCKVEVAPAFPCQGGGYLVCDAHDGGRYKLVHPEAEIAALHGADTALNGNVRKLTRILKQWQRHCNVPIKSFQIEALIIELLLQVPMGGHLKPAYMRTETGKRWRVGLLGFGTGEMTMTGAARGERGETVTRTGIEIDVDTWRGADALPDPGTRANEYVLGLDLGQNAAMSAAAAYFRDGTLEAVACFPELPRLAERGLADGVGGLYQQMADRGELFLAGRRVSDIPALLRECLERWGRPVAITCDRWRLAELKQHLEAVRFPLAELVERGQGFKDGGQDVRDFRAAVLGDHVRPSQSLLLRAAMSEARVTGDPSGNWKLAKHVQGGRRANARDDACAAAIVAVAEGYRRWAARPKRPRWRYRGMAA